MCCFCGCCSNWNGMCWYIQTFLPIHTHLLLHRLSLLKCTFELVLEKFRIFVMETWSLNRRLNANPIKSLTFMKPYYKYSRSQLWEILSVSFCEGIKKKKRIFSGVSAAEIPLQLFQKCSLIKVRSHLTTWPTIVSQSCSAFCDT